MDIDSNNSNMTVKKVIGVIISWLIGFSAIIIGFNQMQLQPILGISIIAGGALITPLISMVFVNLFS